MVRGARHSNDLVKPKTVIPMSRKKSHILRGLSTYVAQVIYLGDAFLHPIRQSWHLPAQRTAGRFMNTASQALRLDSDDSVLAVSDSAVTTRGQRNSSITACAIVRAAVKANSRSNRNGQISTHRWLGNPWNDFNDASHIFAVCLKNTRILVVLSQM